MEPVGRCYYSREHLDVAKHPSILERGWQGLRTGSGRWVRRHVVTQVRMLALTARAVRGQGTDHHDWAAGKTSWRKCE